MAEKQRWISQVRSSAWSKHTGNQDTNAIESVQEYNLSLPVDEYSFLNDFFSLDDKQVAYQFNRDPDYFNKQMMEVDKIIKDWYDILTIKTVVAYIKQDSLRGKNIKSISKLRQKNKEWIPYMIVMLDKIKNYVPRVAVLY